jgi:pentose-5-phosphate-3-epimerase
MPWRDWIRTVEIEPALDAVYAPAREAAIEGLLRTGCRVFHVHAHDVLDVAPVASLAPIIRRYEGILDVHVRNDEPTSLFGELATAGAHSLTFDLGSVDDPAAAIEEVRASGLQVGVAAGMDVDVEALVAASAGADLVLCECEGEHVVEHIRSLAALLPPGVEVQVEGDVSFDNLRSLFLAGARLLVADSPIFEREDLPRAYRRLVQALA